jgi:hypothetical protein
MKKDGDEGSVLPAIVLLSLDFDGRVNDMNKKEIIVCGRCRHMNFILGWESVRVWVTLRQLHRNHDLPMRKNQILHS